MKYSFVIPYYNRIPQFTKTLDSFQKLYIHRTDWEVVVIEDAKNLHNLDMHKDLMWAIQNRPYRIFCIPGENLRGGAAGPSHNKGARVASGEYIILTNPEIFHQTDVLKGLDEEFSKNPNVYVVCACKSLRQDGSFEQWYQHSLYRNENFHFCNALHKKTFELVGGITEDYAKGYCFEDNDFRDKLFYKGVEFVVRDDLLTAHQWHEVIKPSNHEEGWDRNKVLWERNREMYRIEGLGWK